MTGLLSISTLESFSMLFPKMDSMMPVLFVGHGSPMNAIEENEFTQRWKKMADDIQTPKAILCISAHWLTKGTYITAMESPKTIHDFGGFPPELYAVQYPAKGMPSLAKETSEIITETVVHADFDWGLDHGTWSVVKNMYPNADIPVVQLSIDYHQAAQFHFDLGKQLYELRRKGVLIIGSGNMVHNLGMVDWARLNDANYGFDWAVEMNQVFKQKIEENDSKALIQYEKLNKAAKLAIPTPDHYYPLMYTLGLRDKRDEVTFFNDKAVGGSLTMTSVKFSQR